MIRILYKEGFYLYSETDLKSFANNVFTRAWRETIHRRIMQKTLSCGRRIWLVYIYEYRQLNNRPPHILIFEVQ